MGMGTGVEYRIVCFGDSLTACGGEGSTYPDFLRNELPDCEILAYGVPGDTLAGGLARFPEQVLANHPDILVIELGANDYWLRRRSLRALRQDYEAMVAAAREQGIEVVIASCMGDNFDPDFAADEDLINVPLDYVARGLAAIEHDLTVHYQCFYVPDIQADIRPNGREPYWTDYCHPSGSGNMLVAHRIEAQIVRAIERIRERRNNAGI